LNDGYPSRTLLRLTSSFTISALCSTSSALYQAAPSYALVMEVVPRTPAALLPPFFLPLRRLRTLTGLAELVFFCPLFFRSRLWVSQLDLPILALQHCVAAPCFRCGRLRELALSLSSLLLAMICCFVSAVPVEASSHFSQGQGTFSYSHNILLVVLRERGDSLSFLVSQVYNPVFPCLPDRRKSSFLSTR